MELPPSHWRQNPTCRRLTKILNRRSVLRNTTGLVTGQSLVGFETRSEFGDDDVIDIIRGRKDCHDNSESLFVTRLLEVCGRS